MHYRLTRKEDGSYCLKIDKHGQDLIHNPLLNKGTAFTAKEREDYGLEGLLPPHISTIEEQILRIRGGFDAKRSDISKYVFLRALQDRNETLFYSFVSRSVTEMLPIIYTPTVGEAVEKHGHIYRNARGIFLSPDNIGKMDEMAENLPIPKDGVDIIVVTDSQGILGIGDQGVGGMAIPIGKLSLYTVAAGFHPAACLPICLDVGTDNQTLLDDPLYLGHRQNRLKGEEYDSFIKLFVEGVKRNFPNAILQWEDFSKDNAFKNMDIYRAEHPSFNDDVEGTGAVTLAGIIGALKIKGEKLINQNFAIYGAGAAGIGIARQLRNALLYEGLSEEEAKEKIFVVDSRGLVTEGRDGVAGYKAEFAIPQKTVERWVIENLHEYSLSDVVKNAKITALIGVSAQKGSFDKKLISLMMENTRQPIIFPLSNPTSKAEADPREILEFTQGAALVASGSPFPPVTIQGVEHQIGQGNNALVFPGVGLGVLAAKARIIKPSFFTAAAHAVADSNPESRLHKRILYPDFSDLFDISFKVAVAVYKQAISEGIGTELEGNIEDGIREKMWSPSYPCYCK